MKKLPPLYIVHVLGHGPIKAPKSRAKALLKRHGGEFYWLDGVCHVYLKPVFGVEVKVLVPKIAEVG